MLGTPGIRPHFPKVSTPLVIKLVARKSAFPRTEGVLSLKSLHLLSSEMDESLVCPFMSALKPHYLQSRSCFSVLCGCYNDAGVKPNERLLLRTFKKSLDLFVKVGLLALAENPAAYGIN